MKCRVFSLRLLALVLPAVLLDHVRQLDDVLALLVLLARLERLLVLPAASLYSCLIEVSFVILMLRGSRQYSTGHVRRV